MLMRITTCLNVTGRLCAASLYLMLLFPSSPAVAADRAGDEFLTGYIASILERDLHWERDSYILKIVNGVATITLYKDDPVRREAAAVLCQHQPLQIIGCAIHRGISRLRRDLRHVQVLR